MPTLARARLGVVVLALLVVGCTTRTQLAVAPYALRGEAGERLFAAVPEALRTPDMDILYATDRQVKSVGRNGPEYGAARGKGLVFGSARVGVEPALTWEQLVWASTHPWVTDQHRLVVRKKEESARLVIPLGEMTVRDGRFRLSEERAAELEASRAKLYEAMGEKLKLSPSKDVYLFVHGFNNNFDDALFRVGQIWHFMGRTGVPIAYTWPAGRGGLRGYTYDRESGEFTVYHLKRFIVDLANCPGVERLHIVAHSRGVDVAVTALRELNLFHKGKGEELRKVLKLENLVLAAPDLDSDVFVQRFGIEDLQAAAGQTTIYFSKDDVAIQAASWIFGGGNRMGNLDLKDFGPQTLKNFAALKHLHLVECRVTGYSTSHDYVFAHPAAFSDLILLLRDRKPPGEKNGRPMVPIGEGIWAIENDYLLE